MTPDPENPAETAAPAQANEQRAGCLQYGLFIVSALWAVGMTLGFQGITWVFGQLLLTQDQHIPGFSWLLVTWVQGVVVGVPLALMAVLTRQPRFRAAYRTWALSTAFICLLAFARLVPETRAEMGLLAQGMLALGAVALVLWLSRDRDYRLAAPVSAALPSLALVPIFLAPWAAFGALGSTTDVLLGLLAGGSFGVFAGILLDTFLFRPLASTAGREILFGGFQRGWPWSYSRAASASAATSCC